MRGAFAWLGLLVACAPCAAQAPVVATHFFYWYRWPDEHFPAPGREGHTQRFVAPERVSYLDPDWFEAELRAMAACGIDVALPVYWGAPGAYERPGLRFSRDGLAPLVAALERIAADEAAAPRTAIGLFYDTSTLSRRVRGLPVGDAEPDRPDLTEPDGKALFCETVTGFFERIPERHWARIDGRPLVVLYVAAFASRWDRELGSALRAAFAERFAGQVPFLVADASWGDIGQDRTTAWGAALSGPKLHPGVAQIGPGYDDSPVPGRRTPVREREDGAFYEWSWRAAVAHAPGLVLLETWNEMHEGTGICRTVETGERYLDLTRRWTARLRARDLGPELPAPGRLRPRPDLSWGEAARGAESVHAAYDATEATRAGLREVAWEDGACRVAGGALCSDEAPDVRVAYLYFAASDHWRFDVDADLRVTVVREPGPETWLEYDSNDPRATLDGAYRAVRAELVASGDAGVVEEYVLRGARFANRQNGGADFRLVVRGGAARVRRVEVRRRTPS